MNYLIKYFMFLKKTKGAWANFFILFFLRQITDNAQYEALAITDNASGI